MSSHLHDQNFKEQHDPAAIAARLASSTDHSYLGDFILGAIDGVVTTFAIVAGVAGAGYSATVALVLGVANLLADGLSMAVGNYMSTKADAQIVQHVREVEHRHIENVPEGEREEVRQIFAGKGFEGDLLEQIVEVITSDRHRWVDTMVTEEFGLQLDTPLPMKAGLTTFIAFVVAGFLPLFPYCLPWEQNESTIFIISSASAAITFFAIGWAKGHQVNRPRLLSGLEILLVGGAAALVAYGVGRLLGMIVPEAQV